MSNQTLSAVDVEKERANWLAAIEALFEQVQAWSARQGWVVATENVRITEDGLGSYDAPFLTIDTEAGRVHLKPIALDVIGARGRVDLYAYPTLYRVMLLRPRGGGEWRIRTDSGIFLKQPWNEETFVELARDLLAAG